MHNLLSLFKDERGATALEYGLIAVLVSIAAVTAMSSFGQNMNNMYSIVATNVTAATR